MENFDPNDYVKKSIPKPDTVKTLIYNAIKSNTLFRACSEQELADLIDVFDVVEAKASSTVIKQGDKGDHFYVVEAGTLDISVTDGTNEVQVGVPYVSGSAFGELALITGAPRAASIRAKEECKLWSIDRRAWRGITGQYKQREIQRQLNFLRKVKIEDKTLGEVLKPSEIDAMALATQKDVFRKGDVIVREGEKGDIFYLIETGTVEVFKKEAGEMPVASLKSGQFFGERALLTEDVRQATCIAKEDVTCLFLMRQDFNLMLGDLQELLDKNVKQKEVVEENVIDKEENDK
jgi:cGMP-dependent protein kinase